MTHRLTPTITALALVGALLLAPMGCTQADDDRLASLERDVAALKEYNAANREELALVRKNLEAIRDMLELDGKRGAPGMDEATEPPSDEDLDAKTRSFVDKNLNRLMDVTKRLLDKMERELDEQLDKIDKPKPPQGDEI